MELGFRTTDSGATLPVPAESLLIGGDLNIMDVQLVVQYRVKDLDAFVSRVADPERCPDGRTLRDAARSAISQVVGQRPIDDVLTEKKAEVQEDTHELLQQILDSYGTGIQILDVRLQEVKPPMEVRHAYDDVLRARQDKDTFINQAEAYAFDIIPRARGEAQKIILGAKLAKAVRIIQASEEADRFVSILGEYAEEEDEAFRRLYLNSLDSILPGVGEFINAAGAAASSPKSNVPYGHVFPSSLFVSDPAQHTVLPQYSQPRSAIAGLRLTAEFPSTNSDTTVDNRLLMVDIPEATMPDSELQFLVIDAYARYRITDATKLFEKLRTAQAADERIVKILVSALREEVAKWKRYQIIGARIEETVEEGRKVIATNTRQEILDNVLAATRKAVNSPENDFGVSIVDVRIKRVEFPATVQANVFARMRAEQKRISNQFRAQGAEEDARIRAEADRQKAIILVEAQRQANVIDAEGDAEAIDIIMEALRQVPELSRFQKSLESYKISRGLADR